MEVLVFPFYLLITAIIISFYTSFMGGANDFANSFGTSIGSGAISLKQAVMIAVVANLVGAVLVGGHVTDTVRKGIVDPTCFQTDPTILMFGLLAALVGAGVFLQIASQFGLPVSTTHSIVGALVGFGLVSLGFDSISWNSVGKIALSWVFSPIGGGLVGYITFKTIQTKILRQRKPVEAAYKMLPIFVGITAAIVSLSMVYKGMKNFRLDLPLNHAIPAALIIGLVAALLTRRKLPSSDGDSRVRQLEKVEVKFKYLQITTAAYVAFAHGSNDVANGIGPLAGIWTIYQNGLVGLKSEVPVWILLMGGTGIVCGLAIFGRRVIETVGKKITNITPSRGFSAEFSAATVVLVFTKLGMPVSTTHTLVGSVIGVGLARGIGAIDLRVVKRILTSWVVTIPIAAAVTALCFLALKAIFL